VLEELWLAEGKHGGNYGFYKGLIQFAGAFVHLQKNRLRPAAALFKLSRSYLEKYPTQHARLDVAGIIAIGGDWVNDLERGDFLENPLQHRSTPLVTLKP